MANMATYIDGIGSSQAIDTAGEIVDIQGLDISSLVGGPFTWEHKSDLPSQVVGKILSAKKIFSKEDCENARHLYYWNKCKLPFLYVAGRLFDDKKDSSKEVAALFLDDAEHPGENPAVAFSVEGAKIAKQGAVITHSIARKMTITSSAANKTCIAEMLPIPKKGNKNNDFESLFKSEIELFNYETESVEIMQKKEGTLDKIPGWQGPVLQTKTAGDKQAGIHFKHPEHGNVHVNKTSIGNFEVKHNDKLIGVSPSAAHAGQHAKNYMTKLSSGMNKALSAGSGLGFAPGSMVGGSVLSVESLDGSKKKKDPMAQSTLGKSEWKKESTGHESMSHSGHSFKVQNESAGSGYSLHHTNPKGEVTIHRTFGKPEDAKLHADGILGKKEDLQKKEKSSWYNRAEEAYNGWDKKDKFKGYMKKRMPHLAEGEIDAIGRVLALKKNLQSEKEMAKMYQDYYKKEEMEKTTDIMMASQEMDKAEEEYVHGLPKSHPALGNYKGHIYRRARPPVAGANNWKWHVQSPEGKNSEVHLPAETAGSKDSIHAHIESTLPKIK